MPHETHVRLCAARELVGRALPAAGVVNKRNLEQVVSRDRENLGDGEW